MIYRICAFTPGGRILASKLEKLMPEHVFEHRAPEDRLDEWTRTSFEDRLPVVFIGACGIAVRTIAPYIKDKLTDSPVIVIDEAGRFVIPVLSGHAGGANAIAEDIALRLNAQAVVTTATDVNSLFAVDVFAVENGLEILNRDGIRKVSSILLNGGHVNIFWPEDIPADEECMPECLKRSAQQDADIIITDSAVPDANALITLRPKKYVLGIGCRKDTPAQKISAACSAALDKLHITSADIYAAASIDLKAKEKGILRCTASLGIPFYTFTADALRNTQGSFAHSDFVEKTTGVDNVSERSAMCLAGSGAQLVLNKQAADGVTVAAALRKVRITTWVK